MNTKIFERNRPEGAEEDKSTFFRGTHLLFVLVAILMLLNVLLFQSLFFSPQGVLGFRKQCAQVEELQTKVNNLKEENQKLFRKIQGFKNSPRAQEKMVREELGWLRDNELVIEFQGKESEPPR
jgi:cell division protein FtsB